MSNAPQVTGLPPTIGVKDPEVRSFLDALVNAWDTRSGHTDAESPDRFITAREFGGLATSAVVGVLQAAAGGAAGLPGGAAGGGNSAVADAIGALSDEIKRSLLYQILGTEFGTIDVSALSSRIDSAFAEANTLFSTERSQRQTQYEAVTEQMTIQASRIGANEAAITSETSTRVNKDNALASAINNIWAAMGGNSAVIQDGALAAVTPSAAQASRWQQVQAAVTDPNTGQVSSTSIKQDLNSYINKADNTFNSTYSVRAEITSNGRTVVGGFGLTATSGAGSTKGPTIDFGVRADRFWVGDTSGSGDIPFIVTGGKTYIKSALIQDASIDNAKIGYAAIDTLNVGGGAITTMSYAEGASGSLQANGYAELCSSSIMMPAGASGSVVNGFVLLIGVGGGVSIQINIFRNGSPIKSIAVSVTNGFYSSYAITAFDPSPSQGVNTYTLSIYNPASGPGSNTPSNWASPSIQVTGGKR